MRTSSSNVILISLLSTLSVALCQFQDGEYVPTARRAQFHGSRTQWHDLLGRHCPRFASDLVVTVPLPRPLGYTSADEYKLSLAFDGERIVTPWLTLIGRRAPEHPMVDVELTHTGQELRAVAANVYPAPSDFYAEHGDLFVAFANATHWPKHLVVSYHWRHVREVDAEWGLMVLFGTGLLSMLVSLLAMARSYHDKLRAFMEELASDPLAQGGGATGGTAEKAD